MVQRGWDWHPPGVVDRRGGTIETQRTQQFRDWVQQAHQCVYLLTFTGLKARATPTRVGFHRLHLDQWSRCVDDQGLDPAIEEVCGDTGRVANGVTNLVNHEDAFLEGIGHGLFIEECTDLGVY